MDRVSETQLQVGENSNIILDNLVIKELTLYRLYINDLSDERHVDPHMKIMTRHGEAA